jgi:predicted AAA+ superfamily ATPase
MYHNPWWKKEFTIKFNYRELYDKIQKYIPLPQIIAFTGLRRVGKTTMMLKLVEDQIKAGFEPRNIIYLTFDELRDISIKEVIKEYEEIFEKDIQSGKYILLLDEIQKLKDWENQLKVLYDLLINKVKIIISGSESLFIKKKSKETLAGRIFEFKVEPLSFHEFLLFKQLKFDPIKLYESELYKQFELFIQTQGFPELVEIKDEEIIVKYIKESIIEKVIFRDIPSQYKIKDITVLDSLLSILMEDPGQIIELSDLGSELNISRQTLSNYIKYLEDSFLVKKLYNYSPNKRKVERKLKKYYTTILSPKLIFKADDQSRSKVFEWLMVNQLSAEFFWRDPYKNEVDIIKINKLIKPIEIKFGKIETKGLLKFLDRHKLDSGIIISNKAEETRKIEGKTIKIVPGYKFLLSSQFNQN